jgi:hypothetical protein
MQLAPLPTCVRVPKLSLHRVQWSPPTASSYRRVVKLRATEEPSQGPGSSGRTSCSQLRLPSHAELMTLESQHLISLAAGSSGDLEAAFSAELKRRQASQTQERTAPKGKAPAGCVNVTCLKWFDGEPRLIQQHLLLSSPLQLSLHLHRTLSLAVLAAVAAALAGSAVGHHPLPGHVQHHHPKSSWMAHKTSGRDHLT